MNPLYLDHNATTPIAPEVIQEMLPYITENFGNPSSGHAYGVKTKAAVIRARQQVADLLGCLPGEIIFTGGGSESDNLALKGIAFANRAQGNHIITSQIEHPAVLNTCKYLESHGDIARNNNIYFHTDAAQSVGKVPARVDELKVDLLTVAAHKFYGPKGIGALYIRSGTLAITPEIAASTGSACHHGSQTLSPVLAAMGIEPDRGMGSVRISLGRGTTREMVVEAAEILSERAARLQKGCSAT